MGELGILWEHEPTSECFHSFFKFPQTSTSVSIKQLDYELEISTRDSWRRRSPSQLSCTLRQQIVLLLYFRGFNQLNYQMRDVNGTSPSHLITPYPGDIAVWKLEHNSLFENCFKLHSLKGSCNSERIFEFYTYGDYLYWLFWIDFVDVNECNASVSVCDINANCKNTLGSYRCSCKAGFTGDGKTCTGEISDKRRNRMGNTWI